MAKPTVFLATRNPDAPSACRVFGLTLPSSPTTSQQVRSHLLRTWTLYIRIFEDEDTANLYGTGVVDGATSSGASTCAVAASSASSRDSLHADNPPQGDLLCSFFRGVESVVDLSDPKSATSFFLALGSSESAGGVRVQGLSSALGGPLVHPATDLSLGKRQRPAQLSSFARSNPNLDRRHKRRYTGGAA